MKTLVLGGSGYVGRNLIPRLLSSGYRVRCLARDLKRVASDNVEIIAGDATDPTKVVEAMKGCERVVHLIHSMTGRGDDFERLDARIAINVAEAARCEGVKQIVYLGGLGRKGPHQTPHLRSRHEVARLLRTTGVPVTELRAAVIIGRGSASFEMIRALAKRLPVLICPRWVRVKTQPIAIDDAVEYIVSSLTRPEVLDRTLDIGGPDVLSYREMMLTVARQMKLRRLIIPVPALTPWLSSHWVNLVTTVSAPLARALIESVRSETVCEDDTARAWFDFEPLDFEAAVARALTPDK
jgi:uncharacterized protein YbjT (DUF2867 family)